MDYTANIRRVYQLATPEEHAQGMAWYDNAREFARTLASDHNVSLEVAAAVIAIISPNQTWELNQTSASALLTAWRKGRETRVSIPTYRNNTRKAIRLLRTGNLAVLLDSPRSHKTRAFYHCIVNPDTPEVCIDGHSYWIAHGTKEPLYSTPSMWAALYRRIADSYRVVAMDLDLKPYQLQAITWVVWHRKDA